MQLCVLGSGSSGNCTVVRIGGRAMLIDAGFGPRSVARRLGELGMGLADLDAIVLTHLDRDHFAPTWFNAVGRYNLRIYCHERHVYAMYAHPASTAGICARKLRRDGLLQVIDDRDFTLNIGTADVTLRPIHLAHDRTGTIGYHVDTVGGRLGFATDLGRVPETMIDAFRDVDVLAIESNYDPPMQRRSARPAMLKRRIMGGAGHLSNEESFDAVRAIVAASTAPPRHIVLLHLSRQCNDPDLVRQLYFIEPALAERLRITNQYTPTGWLAARGDIEILTGQQLDMWK
ncbi:MBL fold metallo-hydrolase [Planctomycetales bacterium ZRK34]|nr:MBL fold metallo-hydrolase [Planctomycetales bacterium ZRK34]